MVSTEWITVIKGHTCAWEIEADCFVPDARRRKVSRLRDTWRALWLLLPHRWILAYRLGYFIRFSRTWTIFLSLFFFFNFLYCSVWLRYFSIRGICMLIEILLVKIYIFFYSNAYEIYRTIRGICGFLSCWHYLRSRPSCTKRGYFFQSTLDIVNQRVNTKYFHPSVCLLLFWTNRNQIDSFSFARIHKL